MISGRWRWTWGQLCDAGSERERKREVTAMNQRDRWVIMDWGIASPRKSADWQEWHSQWLLISSCSSDTSALLFKTQLGHDGAEIEPCGLVFFRYSWFKISRIYLRDWIALSKGRRESPQACGLLSSALWRRVRDYIQRSVHLFLNWKT